jgi:hypothetical protein
MHSGRSRFPEMIPLVAAAGSAALGSTTNIPGEISMKTEMRLNIASMWLGGTILPTPQCSHQSPVHCDPDRSAGLPGATTVQNHSPFGLPALRAPSSNPVPPVPPANRGAPAAAFAHPCLPRPQPRPPPGSGPLRAQSGLRADARSRPGCHGERASTSGSATIHSTLAGPGAPRAPRISRQPTTNLCPSLHRRG